MAGTIPDILEGAPVKNYVVIVDLIGVDGCLGWSSFGFAVQR